MYCEVNQFVYRYADPVENFYIILSGNVEVLKLKKYNLNLNFRQYSLILYEMKSRKEFDLIKNSLKKNFNIFNIKYNDVITLEFDDFTSQYKQYLSQGESSKPVEYISNNLSNKVNTFNDNYIHNKYLNNTENLNENEIVLKELTLFHYDKEKVSYLSKGDIFGESLDINIKKRLNYCIIKGMKVLGR